MRSSSSPTCRTRSPDAQCVSGAGREGCERRQVRGGGRGIGGVEELKRRERGLAERQRRDVRGALRERRVVLDRRGTPGVDRVPDECRRPVERRLHRAE